MKRFPLVASILLASCGGLPEDSARTLNPDNYVVVETTVSPDSSTANTVDPSENVAVVVYLIRGEGLVSRGRVVDERASLDDILELLVDGPTADETDLGFRSGLTNRPDVVIDSRTVDNIAYVTLGDEVDTLSGDEQILILGQIVLTSLTLPGVSAVQFLRAAEPLSVIAPNGNSLSGPIVRSDFAVLLSR
jgi:spore germination protein GerM